MTVVLWILQAAPPRHPVPRAGGRLIRQRVARHFDGCSSGEGRLVHDRCGVLTRCELRHPDRRRR